MIRLSNNRKALVKALVSLIPEVQTETQTFDETAAKRLRINRTDLRCLGVIVQKGPISAGELARIIKLTRGAMTTALDRLETAGFVQRIDDPKDRRGVKVEATVAARKAVREIWGPIRVQGLTLLQKYTDAELKVLISFFEEYSSLQRLHGQRIRKLGLH